jgi:hypothetical protein
MVLENHLARGIGVNVAKNVATPEGVEPPTLRSEV